MNGRPVRFDSGLEEARKRPGRNAHFAARNETFRTAWHKPLKSLLAPNQRFRGIVCFQWLIADFVSPFLQVVCFQ
jgi:hypothetical protein